jgi:hypothetical protein
VLEVLDVVDEELVDGKTVLGHEDNQVLFQHVIDEVVRDDVLVL